MAKLTILDAAVYCGTYKKYNEGSLDGGWLYLGRYQDGAAFLEACRKLHADESEPEFMYQDSEYLPDEFYSESCIYPEVFEVIQAIKQMNTDKQAAFADFCERGACIPDMFDVEEFLLTYKPNKKPRKTSQSEDMKEFSELFKTWYYLDHTAEALKVDEKHFLTFDKQDIEKSFCFGWSAMYGPTSEEATDMCHNFGEAEFKAKNLERFDREYKRALEAVEDEQITLGQNYTRGTSEEFGAEIMFIKKRGAKDYDGEITLSVEDSAKLREAYKQKVQGLRNEFEKRLDAYLKKYGLSKIRRWTYCADD